MSVSWNSLRSRTQRKSVVKVTIGCKEVDALLGGGVESQSITELYGARNKCASRSVVYLCARAW